ncbi:LLM class flavin-dependent oxidoreductase [Nocardia vinacea]|uniref:LLM class flavin-dependent oxidoreductase n=1 Tax=Nocardia vinacea TaxID=96468 RepID=A0ABZ1YWP1_9NOCA|nr:LLM class flavin-dependent oxidoreductase [Nocardia vinacea]
MNIPLRAGLVNVNPASAVHDARLAEKLGFDLLASGDHVFFRRPVPSAFVQLAVAAGATEHIRLVSTIALLPLYPAALLAKLAASLDQASQGRLELGLGAGGEFPAEFNAVGVDRSTRFRRMDEGLEVLRLLFTGQSVRFDGEFTTLEDVALNPPPSQPGGPPIWLGGRKDRAIRRAGRFADVWLPYLVTPEMMAGGLAKVRGAAVDAGRQAEDVRGAVFAWICVDEDEQWARRTGIAEVSAAYQQDFQPLADRYLVLGSPASVVRRLSEFADAGVGTVIMQIAAPPDARARVVQTIADKILPELHAPAHGE